MKKAMAKNINDFVSANLKIDNMLAGMVKSMDYCLKK